MNLHFFSVLSIRVFRAWLKCEVTRVCDVMNRLIVMSEQNVLNLYHISWSHCGSSYLWWSGKAKDKQHAEWPLSSTSVWGYSLLDMICGRWWHLVTKGWNVATFWRISVRCATWHYVVLQDETWPSGCPYVRLVGMVAVGNSEVPVCELLQFKSFPFDIAAFKGSNYPASKRVTYRERWAKKNQSVEGIHHLTCANMAQCMDCDCWKTVNPLR